MSDRVILQTIMDHVTALGDPPRCDLVGLARASRNIGRNEAREVLERLWGAAFIAGAAMNVHGRGDLNEALVIAKNFLEASVDRSPEGQDGETRLDAKHESAVPERQTPKPHPKGQTRSNKSRPVT